MNGYCCTCAYGIEVPQEPCFMCKNPDSKLFNDRVEAHLRCKKYKSKGSNVMDDTVKNDNVCCDASDTRHERKDKLLRKAIETTNIQLRTLYNQGYKDGREDGYEDGYKAGLELGRGDNTRILQCDQAFDEGFESGTELLWELLRAVVRIPINKRGPIFGAKLPESAVPTLFALIDCMNVDQFMDSMKEHVEENDKREKQTKMDTAGFRLGDEVDYEGRRFIIMVFQQVMDGEVIAGGVGIGRDDKLCALDSWDYCAINQLKKTGRHFDHVEELLKMVLPNENSGKE